MFLRAIFVVLLVHYSMTKEDAVYQVSGVDIVDLIRGFKPQNNMLKLTKVHTDYLTDGVYFQPENGELNEETPYLYLNGHGKIFDNNKPESRR